MLESNVVHRPRRLIVLRSVSLIILIMFPMFLSFAVHAGDFDTDAGNYKEYAVPIDGFTIEGSVGEGDDFADWYVLAGQEGEEPKFSLVYDSDSYDIDLRIYSDDTMTGSLASRISPDTNFFILTGTCYLEVTAFDGSGPYEIVINDGGAESGMDCAGPDEIEPNDSRRDASEIENLTFDGVICENDIDWFIMTGQEGVNPIITLNYDPTSCDIDLVVYTDYTVSNTLSSVSSPDSENFNVPGTCWIKVFSWTGAGEYSVTIEPQDQELKNTGSCAVPVPCQGYSENEPNDEKDLADLITGLEIMGHACEGEDDWYVLGGQEGSGPWFELSYDPTCDIDLEIWDNDELVGSLVEFQSSDRDQFNVEGTCYLRVWGHDSGGDYRITITPDMPPPDPSETNT